MRHWLHRISWEADTSRPLLERGFLTVGFSDFAYPEFLNKDWDESDQTIKKAWGYLPRTRYNLWRFLHEMEKDDLVLVPGWRTYSVYVIKGDAEPIGNIDVSGLRTWNDITVKKQPYGYDDNVEWSTLYKGERENHIDLGFFRRVELYRIGGEDGPEAKDISRYDYADSALTARMKMQQTNADISDLQNNITRLLEAYRRGVPPNLHARIIEEMQKKTLNLIHDELDPDKFESLINWYFKRVGASRVDMPSKNESDKEGDADIIAVFEPIKVLVYVQAKFHRPNTRTDEWAVEQIRAYVDHRKDAQEHDGYARASWVVSTCDDFTDTCKDEARDAGVTLINGQEFARMLIDAGLDGLDTAF